MPYEKELLQKINEDFGFEEEYAVKCMEANRHNHITATYHLINKKNQRNQYMRETFSTHTKSDVDQKRDRMQSQGVPIKTQMGATIDVNQVKAPSRKFVDEKKLNVTQQFSINSTKIKADDIGQEQQHISPQYNRRAATLEVQKNQD